jgi:hypothetical protein
MKQGNLVWRLLRRNISVGQIIGYALANLVGLSIVLTALQFYRDATAPSADGEEAFFRSDYMVISKKVSEVGNLFGGSTTFSDQEKADLKSQPWVKKVGEFTPSYFHVNASVDFGGRGMSTHLFFESIPDEFFDIIPDGWQFDPNDPNAEIPIILSKDYLALYNFGFATSRNMPQISEKLITTIPLKVAISGNGVEIQRQGRVVGFSSRLNTIAVPERFMLWANDRYGDKDEMGDVSRLIVEVSDPGNPAIAQYLEDNGIETAGDKLNTGKTAYFLSIVSMVVIAIGVIISLLAFFILMLSIYLLLQKNREKLHQLMQLGYTPSQAAHHYYLLVGVVNGSILVISTIVMIVVSHLWTEPFESLGLSSASLLPTIIIGVVIMAAITVVNLTAIRRIVKRNFLIS